MGFANTLHPSYRLDIVPTFYVGMPFGTLPRPVTQSVTDCVPTETVGTSIRFFQIGLVALFVLYMNGLFVKLYGGLIKLIYYPYKSLKTRYLS